MMRYERLLEHALCAMLFDKRRVEMARRVIAPAMPLVTPFRCCCYAVITLSLFRRLLRHAIYAMFIDAVFATLLRWRYATIC